MVKQQRRVIKHIKIRRKLSGSADCPRVAVFRSTKHIYAQIISDDSGRTLAFASDLKLDSGTKKDKAYQIGKMLAEKAKKLKIEKAVFDRGGFLYHGRVAEVARGFRQGGIKF